jgi:hypothetical protein
MLIYIYIYIYIILTCQSCVCVYIMLFIKCIHSTFIIVDLVMIKEWSMEIELSIPWSPINPNFFWKWLNLFTWSFGDKVDNSVAGSNVLEVNKVTKLKKYWIMWHCVSMCLEHLWYSRFETSLIAFQLSPWTEMGEDFGNPISCQSFFNQILFMPMMQQHVLL